MLTRTKVDQLADERSRTVALTAPGPRRSRTDWLVEDGAVGGRWPVLLGLAWIVVLVAAVAVEPAPADPDAPAPLWASLLFFGLLSALAVTAGGLSRRRRLGLVASAGAGGLALLASAMCPVSDHHAGVGAWWYLQMVGFTGLVAASVAGLRRARGASAAGA